MDILLFNAGWMTYNILLGVLPIIFALLTLQLQKKYLKYFLLFLWFIFIPNTLYIITDVMHFYKQWIVLGALEKTVLFAQYFILEVAGIVTFLLSIYVFEIALKALQINNKKIRLKIIFINFFMGFGIVLGRFERLNSWEIVTDPLRVLNSSINVLMSLDLVIYSLLFGVFGNVLYFIMYSKLSKYFEKAAKLKPLKSFFPYEDN